MIIISKNQIRLNHYNDGERFVFYSVPLESGDIQYYVYQKKTSLYSNPGEKAKYFSVYKKNRQRLERPGSLKVYFESNQKSNKID